MDLGDGGLLSRERVAIAIWGIGVIAVVKFLHDILQMTDVELFIIAAIITFGSFYGIFLQLWRRLPED